MNMKTLNNTNIELSAESLDAFKLRHKGPVITPNSPEFEESRSVWNAMIDRKPGLVLRCLGVADVIEAVNFAREHNLLICIKGGGHNIAGLAIADGALMLDMSLMRGVWVDKDRKIAHAQAGCVLGDVDRETQLHGLAAVLGFVSLTGITGLTLGGGFGYLTKRFGWTTDNVVGMDVVTADGQLVRASEDENPDLFWGLRGGGGNFGVVTGIDYKLYPIGPKITGGIVAWNASDAAEVVDFYREYAERAPQELSLVCLMRMAPPAPWLPADVHGKPIIAILACYTGDPGKAEEAVAPIKNFGNPVADILVPRPYTQQQALLDGTQPKGRRYYWKSEYLSTLSDDLQAKFIEQAGRVQSPHSAMILFQLGDEIGKLPEDHSPVANRDARYVLNIAGSWDEPSDDNANIEWARSAWNDMKEFSTGGTYVNFLTEDESDERIEASLSSGLQKLQEIKSKWDSDNFFRTNRNIKPA